jgi:hypothetical protein
MACAQKEASNSMADAIREMSRWPLKAGEISIQVRDKKGKSCSSGSRSRSILGESTKGSNRRHRHQWPHVALA